ncbi:MAG: GDP-mannose 4,6-dehydratase [Acidimicrobiia bacterium]|nr:GDP-mannose 4,6-dehydratase [Acidimicrobiia bacterium]
MNELRGARAVVTGGAGFIGSHLVDALLAEGCDAVAVVDTFFLGKEENLRPAREKHGDRLTVYREDAADMSAMATVCQEQHPDIVFDLATKALLYSFFNPPGAFRVNVEIALTLAELQRAGAFGRLVHLSSSEVYGSAVQIPMSEDHPLLAETTYAAGKAAADLVLASYVRMYDADIVTVRPFNNYGPRQNDQALAGIVPLTIRRIREGEAPIIEGDGTQTRDFVYVGDTVDAIIRMATAGAMKGELVNIGSGEETQVIAIVQTIADLLGWEGEFERRPQRKADVLRHCADVSRATSLLGPLGTTPLSEGLARTVAWHRDRQ